VLLLAGQRPGEVFKTRWAHLDLEARWWEMPESAAKNRAAHRVPLLPFSFHRHDLRRTCATNLAKAGVQRQTISRVLNHVDRGPRATLVYRRYEFDTEKCAAREAWDRRFAQILEPPAAQVVAFQRR
jgi:integrase